jgi:hypothetical protein
MRRCAWIGNADEAEDEDDGEGKAATAAVGFAISSDASAWLTLARAPPLLCLRDVDWRRCCAGDARAGERGAGLGDRARNERVACADADPGVDPEADPDTTAPDRDRAGDGDEYIPPAFAAFVDLDLVTALGTSASTAAAAAACAASRECKNVSSHEDESAVA